MRVAVIIPNLHSPVVDAVVEAVLQQADTDLEVWVVGQDRYGKIPVSPQVRTIATPEPVYPGAARNLGAENASADAFIFLDADCVPQPGWLTALLSAWQAHSDAGAISGAMMPQSDTFLLHCGQIANFHEHLNLNPPGERETLASFSLLVPRTAWEQCGGFNPQLRHAEDMDLTLRLGEQGWKLVFEPRARVYHRHARGTWREFWNYARRGGTWSIRVRQHYARFYDMPFWSRWAWAWLLLSPLIAAGRTLQIFWRTPGLWRFLSCAPWVFMHKLAWCLGAAQGLFSAAPERSFS